MLGEQGLVQGPQHGLEPALGISLVRKTLRLAPPRPLLEAGQSGDSGDPPGDRGWSGLNRAQRLVNKDLV